MKTGIAAGADCHRTPAAGPRPGAGPPGPLLAIVGDGPASQERDDESLMRLVRAQRKCKGKPDIKINVYLPVMITKYDFKNTIYKSQCYKGDTASRNKP